VSVRDGEYEQDFVGDHVGEVVRESGDRCPSYLEVFGHLFGERPGAWPPLDRIDRSIDCGEKGQPETVALALVPRRSSIEFLDRLVEESDLDGHSPRDSASRWRTDVQSWLLTSPSVRTRWARRSISVAHSVRTWTGSSDVVARPGRYRIDDLRGRCLATWRRRGPWRGVVQHIGEDVGAVDGGLDAVPVVLLQHAQVAVAELVGDLFDGIVRSPKTVGQGRTPFIAKSMFSSAQ
jgi:hypothetical protein